MELTFLYLPEFVREWDRLRLTDTDLCALEDLIARAAERAAIAERLRRIERSMK